MLRGATIISPIGYYRQYSVTVSGKSIQHNLLVSKSENRV